MALPATLERRQLTSSFGATSGTLVQIKSKWNIRGTHPPLKRNPKLSRRKATSLQIPSVRRTTEQDRRTAVAMQVPLERPLDERVQLQFNRSQFPSSRAFF
uniref:(northern house mosquito) hypothetical protein n=1 Tax=Culex pipiens TaxID=7175 RepID=A0A8D8MNR0_CULPI